MDDSAGTIFYSAKLNDKCKQPNSLPNSGWRNEFPGLARHVELPLLD